MSGQTLQSQFIAIRLTEDATIRFYNILNNNKTPIIKIEDSIYHPIHLQHEPFFFIEHISLKQLVILPYGYSDEPVM